MQPSPTSFIRSARKRIRMFWWLSSFVHFTPICSHLSAGFMQQYKGYSSQGRPERARRSGRSQCRHQTKLNPSNNGCEVAFVLTKFSDTKPTFSPDGLLKKHNRPIVSHHPRLAMWLERLSIELRALPCFQSNENRKSLQKQSSSDCLWTV
jgi:hypothetical protein